MFLFSLYYDILSLTSLKITQELHLLLGFVENQTVFWDFKIRNSARITEGSDNGNSDNRGPTVLYRRRCSGTLQRFNSGPHLVSTLTYLTNLFTY